MYTILFRNYITYLFASNTDVIIFCIKIFIAGRQAMRIQKHTDSRVAKET